MHLLEFVSSPPRVDGPNLRLHVVYTSAEGTRLGLDLACSLSRDLGARLEMLIPQIVPYPMSLDEPAASPDFTEQAALALVRDRDADVQIQVLLCRDREVTVPRWLPSGSIVVVGRTRRWGPGSAWRLIRAIRREGHHVIVADAREGRLVSTLLCERRMSR